MDSNSYFQNIPASRIATFDVFSMGLKKHHVVAMLEFDVTHNRKRLQELRRNGQKISFNAWLIKMVANALEQHPEAAAFLYSKKKLLIFRDINVSILVEKSVNKVKVPLPMVIEQAQMKSAEAISKEIEEAKNKTADGQEVVLQRKAARMEKLYYSLPAFLRRCVWRILLNNPRLAFRKMGNVAITSVGMMGRINGWFIHRSVHPLSIGVGSIISKAVVVNNEIKIRDMLHLSLLVDHDVLDGAPMVRFLNTFTRFLENESPL
jgi:pyruvate/2-oxoglutarate dehydrogenase complex dihydrolipoamide acyltransferase (E2) component